jgi:hypothetical protein
MSNDDFHPQTRITFPSNNVRANVDEALAPILLDLNRLGIRTYESCQNYGEYLRQFDDMAHVWDSKRDYGYIEFFSVPDALAFTELIAQTTGIMNPLFFKVIHGGTPGAWEVRVNLATKDEKWRAWVLFPAGDIPAITELLKDVQ